ncbi:MAG TPA: RtcB family protein [Phycisphaerae bacterium]|jgi:tRNA-splicing ligase RtcB|nr:RtcB family protein [Phycisphaerae bacterium]HOJ54175.1 RtcB family protein [Phycisphaerae bacterium]HOL26634.1 RtcB family protein [Phycisphaerae bacterium]HPP20368.1 RtcB family protein [Phycisphaerae bacterium]HPU32769.1 RtcB family protein [Phycisphaerae bacterium]
MTESSRHPTPLHAWLCEPLPPDVRKALARIQATEDVCHVAVMPDVHLAHDVCIGTVVATRRLIFPQAVGSDIGCGMAVIAFDCPAELLAGEDAAGRLLVGLHETVPAIRQGRGRIPEHLPEPLQAAHLSEPRLEKLKSRDARVQLATLGRGNHFLEFQADETGRLWLMVHTGSRAVGQMITQHHLSKTQAASTGLRYLDTETAGGRAYLSDVQWASDYASWNRRLLMAAAVDLMRRLFAVEPVESSAYECSHNHVRLEKHLGEDLWVHRKGAISASGGAPGIIPGSMGTASYHVEGRGCPESLRSSSHGAGRAMSREEARRRISVKEVQRQMQGVWFDHHRAEELREEAPGAYKDVDRVMRAQRNLTRIIRRLRPVLCYKVT